MLLNTLFPEKLPPSTAINSNLIMQCRLFHFNCTNVIPLRDANEESKYIYCQKKDSIGYAVRA